MFDLGGQAMALAAAQNYRRLLRLGVTPRAGAPCARWFDHRTGADDARIITW